MWQSGGNLVAAFHIVHQYSLSEIAEGNALLYNRDIGSYFILLDL